MLSVIAPIAAGAVLGNLDKDLREFFGSHEPIIVPFMAFTLGQTINLSAVVTAGLPGVMLGVFVLVVTGTCCILADRLLGGSGIAGAAASSTAGNSAAVPKAIALADPTYAAIAAAATIQVTASVIVTAVLTPTSHVLRLQAGAAAACARGAGCAAHLADGGSAELPCRLATATWIQFDAWYRSGHSRSCSKSIDQHKIDQARQTRRGGQADSSRIPQSFANVIGW